MGMLSSGRRLEKDGLYFVVSAHDDVGILILAGRTKGKLGGVFRMRLFLQRESNGLVVGYLTVGRLDTLDQS